MGIKLTNNGWIFLATFFIVASVVIVIASIAEKSIFIFALECLTIPFAVVCMEKID